MGPVPGRAMAVVRAGASSSVCPLRAKGVQIARPTGAGRPPRGRTPAMGRSRPCQGTAGRSGNRGRRTNKDARNGRRTSDPTTFPVLLSLPHRCEGHAVGRRARPARKPSAASEEKTPSSLVETDLFGCPGPGCGMRFPGGQWMGRAVRRSMGSGAGTSDVGPWPRIGAGLDHGGGRRPSPASGSASRGPCPGSGEPPPDRTSRTVLIPGRRARGRPTAPRAAATRRRRSWRDSPRPRTRRRASPSRGASVTPA